MTHYQSILVENGKGGYGGPIKITPTKQRNKFMFLTNTGERPEIVEKISSLTGMEAINGYQQRVQEEEIALVVIDCGGTLRCGIYPKKGIPTINLEPTGRSGPLWRYMEEDIYVSGATSETVNIEGL